jgi:hypothetical protein
MTKMIPIDATAGEGTTTNEERTGYAEAALLAFSQRTGSIANTIGDREDPFLIVADLLADLAHWCDRTCVDFKAALQCAGRHYKTETGAEGRQIP